MSKFLRTLDGELLINRDHIVEAKECSNGLLVTDVRGEVSALPFNALSGLEERSYIAAQDGWRVVVAEAHWDDDDKMELLTREWPVVAWIIEDGGRARPVTVVDLPDYDHGYWALISPESSSVINRTGRVFYGERAWRDAVIKYINEAEKKFQEETT